MNRSSSFPPFSPNRPSRKPANGATDAVNLLRSHDKMSAILPTVARLAALQKDCEAVLPALFEICSVMHYDANQLVLSTPNAAMASKLKQQLPKLQDALLQRGWQISVIRLKVQVGKVVEKQPLAKNLVLPRQAISALAELKESLEKTRGNDALRAALATMLQRHRKD